MSLSSLILIIVAYILGSLPTGIIVSRLAGGVDPRRAGSRNIGATNVTRTVGKAAGAVTLVGDMVKGAIAVIFALLVEPYPATVALTGFFAFFGHLFPVFLGFKGGKGVATACGVMLVISPVAAVMSALVFICFLSITRYVSVGSITAAASLPVFLGLLDADKSYVYMAVAMALLVIVKHKENIRRLSEGKENRL